MYPLKKRGIYKKCGSVKSNLSKSAISLKRAVLKSALSIKSALLKSVLLIKSALLKGAPLIKSVLYNISFIYIYLIILALITLHTLAWATPTTHYYIK